MSKKTNNAPQYRIVFFGNGSRYDTTYVNQQHTQAMFAKYGLIQKPFVNAHKSQILVLALMTEGHWFNDNFTDLDWALGPYLHFIQDSLCLQHPFAHCGRENGQATTDDFWKSVIQSNPDVIGKIKSWFILYPNNLNRYKKFSDITTKTLKQPWGTLLYYHFKTIENVKTNRNWKIDPKKEVKYCPRVSCRECINLDKQCQVCLSTQKTLREH